MNRTTPPKVLRDNIRERIRQYISAKPKHTVARIRQVKELFVKSGHERLREFTDAELPKLEDSIAALIPSNGGTT